MNNVRVKIVGKDVVRFIKNLVKMKINFYDIEYIGNSVYIKISLDDYYRIKKIKTLYEIEITEYYGLLRIKYFSKKYRIILISILISFCIFFLLTRIIFEVSVNHNNMELKSLILDELKSNGISKYKFIVSYKKQEDIKKKILYKYKDKLEWLEIKRIGTKYEILLEERLINNNKEDSTPRNIIAKKNAVITKINANQGEIIGKVDSYVKKGDILISGIIHKKEDMVASVRADGKVYGETWYKVSVELPYHFYNEEKTGKKDKYINIRLFNKNIELFSKKYKTSNNKKILGIDSNLLPIGISINEKYELIIDDSIYSYDNAIMKASSIAKKKLYDKLGKNIEIIYEKDLKYTEENSKIIVVMFYKVIEDITEYGDIVSDDVEIR